MLNAEDRYNVWSNYAERARKFFNDVEDTLNSRFAPYREAADKDTPEIRKLFDMLADLTEFLQEKKASSHKEYVAWDTEQYNLSNCFMAWEFGLCPQVMLKEAAYLFLLGADWKDIARLKQSKGISAKDTQEAVELLKAQHVIEHKAS